MLAHWFLFPALLGATFAGLGLGVRRLSVPFSPALLIPLGYCVAIIVAAFVTWSGHTTDFTGPVVAILAIAGWVFSAGEVRRAIRGGALRREWPWMAAGLAGFLIYGAAVIVSGRPSFTGYNEIVDIASQMQWAAYLADFGRAQVGDNSMWINSYNGVAATGYPAGPWALLGTFPSNFGFYMPWAWDPYLAIMAGCVVTSAYALIRQATESRAFAAIGAFAVGQASPLIGYAHMGGIKELSAAATIVASGALLPSSAAEEEVRPWRAVLPFTLALAGAFSVFSLTILPWLGIFAVGAALLIWRTTTLRTALIRGGTALGLLLLVTLPTAIASRDSFGFARLMEEELGNLADPVSLWAATGVWITSDHRFTLTGTGRTISIVIGVLVIALALVGLWHAWRRGATALLTLWAASIIGLTFLLVRMGQWVDFKGMTLAAPAMLLLAVVGLAALLAVPRREVPWIAWVGVVGLAAVGLYSDGLRYGATALAPHDRIEELREYDDAFYGARGALVPDWDENAAFPLRHTNAIQAFNSPFEATPEWKADPARPQGYQYEWDLDQLTNRFVLQYELVVMRRSPGQSRPGRAYQMAAQGRFFTVWQRTPAPATVAHLALTGTGSEADQAKCEASIDPMKPSDTVTIAPAPPVALTAFDPAKTSKGLTVDPGGQTVSLNGLAGTSEGVADIGPRAGLFEVYANSVTRRSVKVTVEGTTFEVEPDPSAAKRPQYLGTVSLKDGPQAVRLEVGGTSLRAGTSKKTNLGAFVGAVQLIPKDQLFPALVNTTAGKVRCTDPMDWIETP